MSLALATRGYLCEPVGAIPPDVEVGPGPKVIDVDDLVPVIDRIKIEDEEDECP